MPYVDSGKAVYPSIFFSSKEKELKRMDTLYRFGEVSDFHVNGFNVIYKSWPIDLSLWIKLEYTHAYTSKKNKESWSKMVNCIILACADLKLFVG